MTDPSDRRPPAGSSEPLDDARPDDDVVSAYLDGEATDAEIVRVESEPALAERLDRFAEVAAAVREAPDPPEGALDDHVAAAMAVFEPPADPPAGSADADVVDRRSPSFWQRVPLAAVAAAAAVVIVVAGLIGVATTGDDGTDTAAEQLTEDADGDDRATAGAEAPEAFGGPEAGEPGARPAFDSVDELALHLGERFSSDTPATSTEAEVTEEADAGAPSADAAPADGPSAQHERGEDPCDVVALLGLEVDDVVAVVPARVGGRPVTAAVHQGEDGPRLVVVDDATCTISAERAL